MEQEKQDLQERVKSWMARAQGFEQDMHTLQNQIIESKRQNKLLKLAIGRLQSMMDKKEQVIEHLSKPAPVTMSNMIDPIFEAGITAENNANTFMTEAKNQEANIVSQEASFIGANDSLIKATDNKGQIFGLEAS